MAISLDDPKKLKPLAQQAHQVAMNMLRPISRKYDRAEHAYPTELDMLAAMIDGLYLREGLAPRETEHRHAADLAMTHIQLELKGSAQ